MRRWVVPAVVVGVACVNGCALDESGAVAVRRPDGAPTGLEVLLAQCPDGGPDLGSTRVTDIDVRVESNPVSDDPVVTFPVTSIVTDPATGATVGSTVVDVLDVPNFARRDFDRTVWWVHSDEARSLTSVVVGETPSGFESVVPLTEPLPERVLVVVGSSEGDDDDAGVAEISVLLSDLPFGGDIVYDEEGITTGRAFADRVRLEECAPVPRGERSTIGSDVTSFLLRGLLVSGGALALLSVVLAVRNRPPVAPPPS